MTGIFFSRVSLSLASGRRRRAVGLAMVVWLCWLAGGGTWLVLNTDASAHANSVVSGPVGPMPQPPSNGRRKPDAAVGVDGSKTIDKVKSGFKKLFNRDGGRQVNTTARKEPGVPASSVEKTTQSMPNLFDRELFQGKVDPIEPSEGKTSPQAPTRRPASQPVEAPSRSSSSSAAASSKKSVPPPAPPPGAAKRPPLLSLPEATGMAIQEPSVSPDDPPRFASKRVDDPNNPLGLTAAKRRIDEVNQLLQAKQTGQAIQKLEPLKDWLIIATEAHIDLYKTLNRLPSARVQAEFEKQLALEFAKLRDQSLLQLGQLYIQSNQKDKAVKLLVSVVQSQTRSPVGQQAYQSLQDIGFTEALQIAE